MKNTLNPVVFTFFSIVLFSFFSVPVYGASDEVNRFEKVVKQFTIKGVTLSSTPAELEAIYARNGLVLKRKQERKRNGNIYSFTTKNDARSIRSKVFLDQNNTRIVDLAVTIPRTVEPVSSSDFRKQIKAAFGEFGDFCQWKKDALKCKVLTNSEELKVDISLGKVLKYRLSAKPSRKAQIIFAKMQKEQARLAKQAEIQRQKEAERKQWEREQAQQAAEEKKQQEKQARLEAEKAAAFLESISDHPCREYDNNDIEQVRPCIEVLEKRWIKINEGYIPGVMYGSTCTEIRRNVVNNLMKFGFSESEAKKRQPSCAVLAKIHQSRGNKVYWSACLEHTEEPLSVDAVTACIAAVRLNRLPNSDCETMKVQYRKNMNAAGIGIEGQPLAMPSDVVMKKVCEKLAVIRKKRAEQAKIIAEKRRQEQVEREAKKRQAKFARTLKKITKIMSHDPDIYKWLHDARYEKIPFKQWYNRQLGLIMLGFTAEGCFSNDAKQRRRIGKHKQLVLNMASEGKASNEPPDAMMLLFPEQFALSSAFLSARTYIEKNDCGSKKVQQTVSNLIDLIIARGDRVNLVKDIVEKGKFKRSTKENILGAVMDELNFLEVTTGKPEYPNSEAHRLNNAWGCCFAKEQVLSCQYSVGNPDLISRAYHFWYKTLPEEAIAEVRKKGLDKNNRLSLFGPALTECPKTETEARTLLGLGPKGR